MSKSGHVLYISALVALTITIAVDRGLSVPYLSDSPVPNRISISEFRAVDSNSQQIAESLTSELLVYFDRDPTFVVVSTQEADSGSENVDRQDEVEVEEFFVLQGGVRVSENRVTLCAKLIDTSDDSVIWEQGLASELDLDQMVRYIHQGVTSALAQTHRRLSNMQLNCDT